MSSGETSVESSESLLEKRPPLEVAVGSNRRRTARLDVELLLVAMAVLALAAALQVLPEGRVAFRGFADFPLPGSCPLRETWQIPCPGCGLKRSFVYLAHGQVRESLAVQPVGWVLFLAVALQIPYRVAALLMRREPFPRVWRVAIGWSLGVLLIVTWLVRVVY